MAYTGTSRSSWYNDFLWVMAETDSPHSRAAVDKMLRRQNSSISRSHRLESVLSEGSEPSPMQIRAAMVQMAQIARTTSKDHLREQAILIYDECWKLLRKLDLGLSD